MIFLLLYFNSKALCFNSDPFSKNLLDYEAKKKSFFFELGNARTVSINYFNNNNNINNHNNISKATKGIK